MRLARSIWASNCPETSLQVSAPRAALRLSIPAKKKDERSAWFEDLKHNREEETVGVLFRCAEGGGMRSRGGPLVLIRQISRRIRKCLQELQSAAKHTHTNKHWRGVTRTVTTQEEEEEEESSL